MNTGIRTAVVGLLWLAVVVGCFAGDSLGDGMIVPVRPDLRVRGSWAVKYHHVDISVRDQVASVHVDQEFVNTGAGMVEVEYFFPVPPGAAIDSMTLIVDGKEFAAKVYKADEARKIYEEIVRTKKDPALLEYVGFGLLKTSAFPLVADKPAKVVVTYKYICKKDSDLVEVWYPMNTEKYSAKAIEDVSVRLDVKCDADITAVYSPTHDLAIERRDSRQVIATYKAKDVLPITDFQVFYRTGNEAVGATLLTQANSMGKDGYFMMLVSPNPRETSQAVMAKDVVVVLDRSGSMSGEKIQQARDSVRFVLKNLNDKDRFNVISFDDRVEPFFEHVMPASEKNIAEAIDRLDRTDARGATDIHEALATAMKMLPTQKHSDQRDRPAYIIFFTDGQPTTGKTDEGEIIKDTTALNTDGVRLFCLGVGYDVNVRLLDKLVGENHGKSDYVKPKENIEAKVSALYAKIRNPVMTGLKVSISGVRIRDTYPREVPDLFEGDQIVMVGRYDASDARNLPGDKPGAGAGQATLVISGDYQGKNRAFEYNVEVLRGTRADDRYAFVEQLWAMRRVGFLLDQVQLHGQNKEVIDEIVQLSKDYGIITPYTSFLADERTSLASTAAAHHEMMDKAADSAKKLEEGFSGGEGQNNAMNRQALNQAAQARPSAAPAAAKGGGGGRDGAYVAQQVGASDAGAYERGEQKALASVRQVNNQVLYRRGQTWMTPDAAKIDAEKDADKIIQIDRFSKEYFELAAKNSVQENQVLSTQQAGEELRVVLRGQAYNIR
jgi:Ca-activated chloride channel family protein